MAQQGLCYIPPQVFCSAELTSYFACFNIMSGRNTRLRLLDKYLERVCIGLWDTNCLKSNILDANVTDVNGLDTIDIACYCILCAPKTF
jgi:hypothetical protein